ncbi:C2H2-type zinc finger-containing protein [Heterostelium album PN500]|uniref:U1 small nuclear ribonucleoprotein C n=1 Tax=Heterostelium pallidum (strain ATCC 26659 / Pp 5 / PN500) TaxID=670386 RepID=RU1C_HETP5|nr:C2H2-type zinc finger-containing protein [Heterostelium album PN500]D3B3B7.1 RecName: Full=U1 small nuclear ribonucleoprotein C; Short=U1 snRNP C; Short=U1-C; Short=U1C [Heterostelium album PN500]EFA83815.1 C2H2-type zinc finger-containing protein [Heterostelium album PN500]|eukprot:XP_020435932.1 C2H2-type zinc finger-containing protein [Heterostelium album PN500]
MPKYYCEYCDKYLTHDSPSVRKSHTIGKVHQQAVTLYYKQFEAEWFKSQMQQKGGQVPMMPPFGMQPGLLPPNMVPGQFNIPMMPPGQFPFPPPPGQPMGGMPPHQQQPMSFNPHHPYPPPHLQQSAQQFNSNSPPSNNDQ